MANHASNPVNADGEPIDVPGLVQQARKGDETAFGELMQAYHQRVYGILIGMVRSPDDARDLAQQAWIKVWNKLHTFKGDADFYTWLYRVTTFVGLDFIRKRNRKREVDLLEEMDPDRDPDSEVPPSLLSRPDRAAQAAEIRDVFDAALETLSPEHRTALLLREVEGLSYDEIAKVMKCRRGTVMSRIFYARKSIQEKLKGLR
jgi:RNA polymerase sigma-70 factor, ECF subfamily